MSVEVRKQQPSYSAADLLTANAALGVGGKRKAMPYVIKQSGDQHCVHKQSADGSAGELVKCHPTEGQARAHMRALYANVSKEERVPETTYADSFLGVVKKYLPKEVLDQLTAKARASHGGKTRAVKLRELARALEQASGDEKPATSTAAVAKAERSWVVDRCLRLAKAEDDSDPDEDPGHLAQAVDEVLDGALEAFAAGNTDQALALVVSAAATIDALLEALNVADPDEVTKAEMTADERNALPDSAFADPKNRRYPLKRKDGSWDKRHIANARSRCAQGDTDCSPEVKARIDAAAKAAGVGEETSKAEAMTMEKRPARMPYGDGGPPVVDPKDKHPFVSTKNDEGKCAFCGGDLGHDNHWEQVPVYKGEDTGLLGGGPVWVVKAEQPNGFQGIVYGVVLSPDLKDAHDDKVPPDEIEKAAHRWLGEAREQSDQHRPELADAVPVESYIAPIDMDIPRPDGKIVHVLKGAWVMASKVRDPKLLEAVLKGERTGYSIEGSAIRRKEEGS